MDFQPKILDFKLIISTLFLSASFLDALTPAIAQIVPDGSLGNEASIVVPNIEIKGTPSERIDGGSVRGANLFHSFGEFNISPGRGAYFSNPDGITNILTRVTGTNPSNIFGTLGVLGNANLFLINPNGIVFGPNSRLDLRGSFLATSASGIAFDGFEFSTINPQAPPLLTVNIPIGLRFRDNPGNITVQGTGNNLGFDQNTAEFDFSNRPNGLQVDANRTLALVGGEVIFTGGNITASGGRIELGSVGGSALVNLAATNLGWVLDYTGINNFGDIRLAQAASVTTRGEGGGPIQVQGRLLALAEGSVIDTTTVAAAPGGSLTVKASEAVELTGTSPDGQFGSSLYASVNPTATGKGGDITIETGRLLVTDGGQVFAGTLGQGDAGNLIVGATEAVELFGTLPSEQYLSLLYTTALPGATGNGGDITIATDRLLIAGGAQAFTGSFGPGKAGNIIIRATDTVELSGVMPSELIPGGLFSTAQSTSPTKTGADITIDTGRFLVTGGAQISSSTLGLGKAGNITVRARESVEISGVSVRRSITSTLSSSAQEGKGNGGDITIETPRLLLANGGQVSTGTFAQGDAGNLTVRATESVEVSGVRPDQKFPSGLFSVVDVGGTGKGGELTIETARLLVTGGGIVSSATLGQGDAGNITTRATDAIEISGTSPSGRPSILAGTVAPIATGKGSTITIQTPRLQIDNGARISVSDGSGTEGPGNIEVNADTIRLSDRALIDANTKAGTQGNITLNSTDIQLRRDSQISTNASEQATGGNIIINSDILLAFPGENSDITANAQDGPGGRIEINVPNIFGISALTRDELAALLPPESILDPTRLLSSDITAISQAESQLSGQVIFSTSGINPAQGLVELPQNVIDPAALITANPCVAGATSQFIVTGRGGLPVSPANSLSDDGVRVGWSDLPAQSGSREAGEQGSSGDVTDSLRERIVPAQGWAIDDKGEVTLVAYNPGDAASRRTSNLQIICPPR